MWDSFHHRDHHDDVAHHVDVAQEGGWWGVTTVNRSLTRLSCRDMEEMWFAFISKFDIISFF